MAEQSRHNYDANPYMKQIYQNNDQKGVLHIKRRIMDRIIVAKANLGTSGATSTNKDMNAEANNNL